MANSLYRKNSKRLEEKMRRGRKATTILIIVFLLLAVLMLGISMREGFKQLKHEGELTSFVPSFVSTNNITFVSMKVPAIDAQGKGVSTLLVVEAMPGTGRTLVDIDNLLFWADTQHSMRIARLVAANITGINVNNFDLIYSIYANASTIGGESAGAALTIATIAALQNKSINSSVMITGTINHDGSIGPVSHILEKAKASKDANATLFLVPLLQSRDVIYKTTEHCEKFGWTEVCTTETLPQKVNVKEKAGIETREVATIQEALSYFYE